MQCVAVCNEPYGLATSLRGETVSLPSETASHVVCGNACLPEAHVPHGLDSSSKGTNALLHTSTLPSMHHHGAYPPGADGACNLNTSERAADDCVGHAAAGQADPAIVCLLPASTAPVSQTSARSCGVDGSQLGHHPNPTLPSGLHSAFVQPPPCLDSRGHNQEVSSVINQSFTSVHASQQLLVHDVAPAPCNVAHIAQTINCYGQYCCTSSSCL